LARRVLWGGGYHWAALIPDDLPEFTETVTH